MRRSLFLSAAVICFVVGQPAVAQSDTPATLRAELVAAQARIDALEKRLAAIEASPPAVSQTATRPDVPSAPIERVGEAPVNFDRPPEIAVLGDQGAVITRAGQLTGEFGLEYARADRNRAVFRGIELVESVLVGVFDINESRQDVLTAALGLRYGLTDRLEIGGRIPFIRRSDNSVLMPIAGSTADDEAASTDSSARDNGVGDLEMMLRYQLTRASADRPFFVGNIQLTAPTGTSPFAVPRDSRGRALKAATGGGFWGLGPSITAILPSDPVVLFGSVGYTYNFARSVDTEIPPVRIIRVKPGNALSASAGVGLAFNERTSVNLGYAHTWGFGTETTTELLNPGPNGSEPSIATARDLQIGRLLFGVTYRLNNQTSVNWGVEVGATEDATDLRTTLRVPITLISGR